MFKKWGARIFSYFLSKKTLKAENKELAVLVRVLLTAIEDGKLSKEELNTIKKAAYDVVIKYDL